MFVCVRVHARARARARSRTCVRAPACMHQCTPLWQHASLFITRNAILSDDAAAGSKNGQKSRCREGDRPTLPSAQPGRQAEHVPSPCPRPRTGQFADVFPAEGRNSIGALMGRPKIASSAPREMTGSWSTVLCPRPDTGTINYPSE